MTDRKLIAALLIVFSLITTACVARGQDAEATGFLLVRLEGVISVASAELVSEAIAAAEDSGDAVVLLLDTPGGSLDATFRIVEAVERSTVPVIGFVQPHGARAWSAGTYILLATDLAAMAPNTIIGSCQPVAFDPLGGSQPINDTKQINALTKYIGERARANGRNVAVAERFVTENLNLNEVESEAQGVVEYVAVDLAALVGMLDGVQVEAGGRTVTLRGSAPIREHAPSLRVSFLGFVSDPTLAYLLFMVGFYGLILGLYSPGLGAEAVGGLMLLLGLVGLGVFGVNMGGVLLVVAGLALLVAETQIPGFGAVGVAGLICIIIGGFLLFPEAWAVQGDWLWKLYAVLILVPLVSGALFAFVAYKVLEARRRKPYQGELAGGAATSLQDMKPGEEGFVLLDGETWKARALTGVRKGARVRVVSKDGPVLLVEPEPGRA
jgi:membrane-bound serine protease (ClpP class)